MGRGSCDHRDNLSLPGRLVGGGGSGKIGRTRGPDATSCVGSSLSFGKRRLFMFQASRARLTGIASVSVVFLKEFSYAIRAARIANYSGNFLEKRGLSEFR